MRLSIAISWQRTEFGAIAKGDPVELVAQARELGYDAVELAVRDPKAIDLNELKECLDGMSVSAMGTGQAYLTDGLSLTDESPDVREAAVQRLVSHCELASELHCPLVIIGLIRGRNGNQNYLVDSLRRVSAAASDAGVRLVIEPINRYETNLVNSSEQAIDLIARVGVNNIGLLLDTFHMNIEEPNPAASLIACVNKLWHVHLADSNRLAPGMGHLDFRQIMGVLQALRYGSYVSAEIMPHPDALTAMKMALESMGNAI